LKDDAVTTLRFAKMFLFSAIFAMSAFGLGALTAQPAMAQAFSAERQSIAEAAAADEAFLHERLDVLVVDEGAGGGEEFELVRLHGLGLSLLAKLLTLADTQRWACVSGLG
jgi:hypothetical protein